MFYEDLKDTPDFDLKEYVNPNFFREVSISLVRVNTRKMKGKTMRLYELIHKHREEYYIIAGYEPIEFKHKPTDCDLQRTIYI